MLIKSLLFAVVYLSLVGITFHHFGLWRKYFNLIIVWLKGIGAGFILVSVPVALVVIENLIASLIIQ